MDHVLRYWIWNRVYESVFLRHTRRRKSGFWKEVRSFSNILNASVALGRPEGSGWVMELQWDWIASKPLYFWIQNSVRLLSGSELSMSYLNQLLENISKSVDIGFERVVRGCRWHFRYRPILAKSSTIDNACRTCRVSARETKIDEIIFHRLHRPSFTPFDLFETVLCQNIAEMKAIGNDFRWIHHEIEIARISVVQTKLRTIVYGWIRDCTCEQYCVHA